MKISMLLFLALLGACTRSNDRDLDLADVAVDFGVEIGVEDASDLSSAPDLTMDADPDVGDLVDEDLGSDLGAIDLGAPDDGPDLAPCVPPVNTPPPLTEVPLLLSETGLYADVIAETLADGVRPFQPRYVLWSDGATKDRHIWLPPCEQIDNSDQDQWSFPIGTRVWKTFTRDGIRIETRLIMRWGPGPKDYFFSVYLWRDDGTDADYVQYGVSNAKGTAHDVPAIDNCEACHGHLPEPYLGVSAIMLTHQLPGVNITDLSNEGLLTVPAPAGFEIPGNATIREALGYVHANCSNCHNETADTVVFDTPFSLRTSVGDATPQDTGAYRTAVAQPVTKFVHPDCLLRIDPRSPTSSCVYVRMGIRGGTSQMPVIGTKIVDPVGLAAVRDWINALP